MALYSYSATQGIHLLRGAILRVADYSPDGGLQIPAKELVIPPVSAKLAGARLSDRPAGWTPYEISSKGFPANNAKDRLKNNYQILVLRSQQIGSIRGADLAGANLDNADLSRTFAVNSNLFGSSFRNASLFRTDMEGVTSCDPFANPTLADSECRVDFEGATLDGTRLTLSNLANANFRRSRLRVARFLGATLREADFSNAIFMASPFYFVDARKAVFDGVNARTVTFRWSLLQGANLSKMSPGPTNIALRDNIGDSSTLLPEGVSIPTCFLENDDFRKGSLSAIPHLSDLSAERFFCRSAERLCFAGKWPRPSRDRFDKNWPGKDGFAENSPGGDGFECCLNDQEPDSVCKQVLESWSPFIKGINFAPEVQ